MKSKQELQEALEEHQYLREVGGFAMEHTISSVYSSTTVVRQPTVTVRGRWGDTDPGFLGEQLLLNYRPHGLDLGFQQGIGRFMQHDAVVSSIHRALEEDTSNAIELPKPKRVRTGLSAVMAQRRSKRNFAKKPISLEELSTLLQHADGMSGHLGVRPSPLEPEQPIGVRCAPSGGGLYPISLYVVATNVKDLTSGIYQYLPNAHALAPVRTDLTDDEIAQLCFSPDFDFLDTAFGLIYSYDFHKNSQKYGNSGLVFGLIEVGGIAQNLHLARTALGFAGCCQGGYNKQELEKTIGLDGVAHHVVHFTVIGQESR